MVNVYQKNHGVRAQDGMGMWEGVWSITGRIKVRLYPFLAHFLDVCFFSD